MTTILDGVQQLPGPDTQPSDELLFPLSSSQQRCWFVHALSPGSSVLNIALRWEIKGRFSASTIEQAFQTIIDRHEILRTRFIDNDGEPMQDVAARLDFHLSVVDLTVIPEEKRPDEAIALGLREAHVPFDIGQSPLIRATLLRLSADHGVLLVTVHQIVFDGWSIRNLAYEFGTIAAALDAERPYDLPELPLQYGDYCLWQKEFFASSHFEAETAYWKNKLSRAPYFEISPDHERPAQPTYRGEILAAILPPALGDKLEEAARKRNVSLFSLGCAATALMLHRYSGAADVIFGTQIAGRDDPDLDNMIGIFLNNLVMRFDASGDPTFDDFLTRVNATVQDGLIHQRMPFHKLVEVLNPPRDSQRTPLISINFTVLRDVMDHKTYGSFDLHGQPSLSAGSLYDLFFFMVHWPNGWRLAVEFNLDLFERRTAERMLEFLTAAIEFAISNPDARLSSLVPPAREEIAPPDFSDGFAAIEASRPPPGATASVGPADAERKMMAIWRDVLQVREIGPTSNFFELGGHSLMAMRLVTKIASTFGVKINVMTLFQAPTVREFTAHVSRIETPPEPWRIVKIQPLGDKTPIIAINNTMIYYNLARRIGTDRPFLGVLQFDPNNPRSLACRDMEEIVADYVRLIREARPHGPYILMGFCVAGVIAFVAAQQLRQAGESVPLVVVADSWVPGYSKRLPIILRYLFRWSYRLHSVKHKCDLVLGGKQSVADFLLSFMLVRQSRIMDLAAALHLVSRAKLGKAKLVIDDWANQWFLPQLEEACWRYQASASVGNVVVLQSDHVVTRFADSKMGWSDLVKGRLFIHRIPGWHVDMFQDEGADRAAEHLRSLLDQVDAERDHMVRSETKARR
ncbi:MAG: condensation domain-containing protein [Methylocella sp.]